MFVSLVDRILSVKPLSEIRALKNLSFRENYLRDHFPGFPLMPGALQLEAMIQAGQWLLRSGLDFPRADFLPCVVANSRYSRYVRPGDQFVMTVTMTGERGPAYRFRGVGEVDGERAAQAQFEIVRYEAAWSDVSDARAEALLEEQRQTFEKLCRVAVADFG